MINKKCQKREPPTPQHTDSLPAPAPLSWGHEGTWEARVVGAGMGIGMCWGGNRNVLRWGRFTKLNMKKKFECLTSFILQRRRSSFNSKPCRPYEDCLTSVHQIWFYKSPETPYSHILQIPC